MSRQLPRTRYQAMSCDVVIGSGIVNVFLVSDRLQAICPDVTRFLPRGFMRGSETQKWWDSNCHYRGIETIRLGLAFAKQVLQGQFDVILGQDLFDGACLYFLG